MNPKKREENIQIPFKVYCFYYLSLKQLRFRIRRKKQFLTFAIIKYILTIAYDFNVFSGCWTQRGSRDDGVGRPSGPARVTAYHPGNAHQREDVQLGGLRASVPEEILREDPRAGVYSALRQVSIDLWYSIFCERAPLTYRVSLTGP